MKRYHSRIKGYNLIEVIIAVGLLAWVLLAIAGLFAMGQRNVHSGNLQTKSAALGQEMIEDLRRMSRDDRLLEFGAPTTGTTTHTVTINRMADSDVDTNAPDTDAFKTWYDGLTVTERWQYRLRSLPVPSITVSMTPKFVKAAAGTPTFGTCVLVQYEISVNYTQGLRPRSTTFRFSL